MVTAVVPEALAGAAVTMRVVVGRRLAAQITQQQMTTHTVIGITMNRTNLVIERPTASPTFTGGTRD